MALVAEDPRLQLNAYLTDPESKQLFQVVKRGAGGVTLENCRTYIWFAVTARHVLERYRLVEPKNEGEG